MKDLADFDGRTKILEFENDTLLNRKVFDNLKQKMKESYAV